MGKAFLAYLILLVPMAVLTSASAQETLSFKVVWRGDSIGYFETQTRDSSSYQLYNINSEVAFWLFGKRRLYYNYRTVYDTSSLLRASSINTLNGSVRSSSAVFRTKGGYDIFIDDKEEQRLEDLEIFYSVSKLYYEEPVGVEEVFSERYGTFMKVEVVEPNKYKVEKPGGRYNIYTFVDGKCTLVEVNNWIAKFYFKRISD